MLKVATCGLGWDRVMGHLSGLLMSFKRKAHELKMNTTRDAKRGATKFTSTSFSSSQGRTNQSSHILFTLTMQKHDEVLKSTYDQNMFYILDFNMTSVS